MSGTEGYDNPAYVKEGRDSVVEIDGGNKGSQRRERLTYSWQDLNVFAPVIQGCFRKSQVAEKHILRNVTGICRPGELLAVMGASGAGKTTLLNCLNFRSDPTLKIKGKLYINGQRVSPDILTSRSAYVQQEDIFVGTITVKEQLVFQANLRMDKDLSTAERMQRVEDVMIELNLVHCANTYIGIPGTLKGISGGETKRLAFACEVLTNPPIMFCDEPTTGLDSFMAQNIVEVMMNLAKKGMTIISTIHQPSSEVFAMFNRVLLMAEGRTAYLGSTAGAMDFFAGMGKVCPENYNPADYFIDNLAIQPEKEEECKQFVESACDAFDKSSTGQLVLQGVEDNAQALANESAVGRNEMKVSRSPYKASWGSQFSAVLKRCVLENVRDRMVVKVKLAQYIMISLIVGLIYFDQTYDRKGVDNINGAIFLILTQVSFSSCFAVVRSFCAEGPLFLREHFNGMYRVDVYFLAKNLAELPLNICLPILFVSISYFMIGLNPEVDRFFIHMGLIVLTVNAVTSFGFMISCISKNEQVASALSAPLLIPLMLFGGLFMNNDLVPDYLIWIKYISWFYYGFEDLSINQWKGVDYINATTTEGGVLDGEGVLDILGFEEDNMIRNVVLLASLLIGFRFLAFLALLFKARRGQIKSYE